MAILYMQYFPKSHELADLGHDFFKREAEIQIEKLWKYLMQYLMSL